MNRWLCLVGVVAVLVSCGEPDRAPTPPPAGGNTGIAGSIGKGGASNASGGASSEAGAPSSEAGGPSGEAGAGGADALAPLVEITSPEAVSDPNDGGVLSGASVKVDCRVRAVDAAIDTSSVRIAALDASDTVVLEQVGVASPPNNQDATFSAEFFLAEYEAGKMSFRCTARDSEQGRQGKTEIDTFLDKGPIITAIEPLPKKVAMLESVQAFEFTIEPALLTDDDIGAAVGAVSLKVGETSYELSEDPKAAGHYRTNVDFLNDSITAGLTQIEVTAANQREPEAVSATLRYDIVIDGEGPVITVKSPKEGAVVGEKLRLEFTVVDAVSNVKADTIKVVVNNDQAGAYHYAKDDSLWATGANGAYVLTLDSTQITGSKVQVTISITANDAAGNESQKGVLVNLDNVPPEVDLDPAPIRVSRKAQINPVCSGPFDLLGEAVGDLGDGLEATLFRAIVWDQTNSLPGKDRVYAGIKAGSIALYTQPTLGLPLYIDDVPNDGSDRCTGFASNAVKIDLQAVDEAAGVPPVDENLCPAGFAGTQGSPYVIERRKLCTAQRSDLTFVPRHINSLNEFALYAIEPNVFPELCTGDKWEITSVLHRLGWACVGATAADNAGNVGFARPIRVCIDDGSGAGKTLCAASSPPTCTDTCDANFPKFTGSDTIGPGYITYDGTGVVETAPPSDL